MTRGKIQFSVRKMTQEALVLSSLLDPRSLRDRFRSSMCLLQYLYAELARLKQADVLINLFNRDQFKLKWEKKISNIPGEWSQRQPFSHLCLSATS